MKVDEQGRLSREPKRENSMKLPGPIRATFDRIGLDSIESSD
jgi:hypothetical protein